MEHTLDTIHDSDNYFVIDPITRSITNLTNNKNSLIQYDHNSEVFTFKIPRMIEGHDMSLSDSIEIHYINKGQSNTSFGIYKVTDIVINKEDDSEFVICKWLISQNATRFTGDITFQIKFICYCEDILHQQVVDYIWSTKVFSAVNVLPGINNADVIVETYPDVLMEWETRLFSLSEEGVENINTAMASASNTIEQLKQGVENINTATASALNDVNASKDAACMTVEQKGESVKESIPDDYTDLSDKMKNVSNAIKGTKSGAIVTIDDMSPLKHDLSIHLTSDTVTDFSDVTVCCGGKNLFSIAKIECNEYVKVAVAEDGTVTMTNPTGSNKEVNLIVNVPLNTPLAFSILECDSGVNIRYYSKESTWVNPSVSFNAQTSNCFTAYSKLNVDTPQVKLYVFVPANSTYVYKGIQIERGTVRTDYEAYKEPQTITANADGTVSGLTSISPTMVLSTDTEGVDINVGYNKDANKYINKVKTDVDTLQEEIYETLYDYQTADTVNWVQGSVYRGWLDPSLSTNISTDFIKVPKGEWHFETDYKLRITKYDSQKNYVSNTGNYTTISSYIMEEDGYIRISVEDLDGITPDEGNSNTINFSIYYAKTDTLQEEIYEMQKDIDGILDNIDPIVQLPTYWQNHLDEKTSIIQTNSENCALNGDSFIFFTDYHIENNVGYSHLLMKKIVENTTINRVVFGGDVLNSSPTSEEALEKIRKFAERFSYFEMYPVRGNHEYNLNSATSGVQKLEESQIYNYLIKPIENKITKMPNGLFYYQDNTNQKIRYIFVDTKHESYISYPVTEAEIQWLKDRLTELEHDWSVIVFSHQGMSGSWGTGYTPNAKTIIDAIQSVLDTMSATFVAFISGHNHCDTDSNNPTYNYTYENDFLIISVTCDARQEDTVSGYSQEIGTINEHAFDVFSIDTLNRTIKATRIGRGVDREWTY